MSSLFNVVFTFNTSAIYFAPSPSTFATSNYRNMNIVNQWPKIIIKTNEINIWRNWKVPAKSISVNVVFTFNASINCTKLSSVTRQPTNQRTISHRRESNTTSYSVYAINSNSSICSPAMCHWNEFSQSTHSIPLLPATFNYCKNGTWVIVENQFVKRTDCFEKNNLLFV